MDLSTMAQFNLKSPEQLFAAFAKFSESNKESTATDQTDNESYSRSLSPEVKSEDCKMEIDENCNNNEMALQSILGDDNSFAAELFKNVAQSQMDESTTPTKNAGYRAELKRPDLKGQFRCTICNKVFCHSSSLSRHRMQAHFKSYTCTLCSKEITSKLKCL
ncbi:unnamed protein product [Bursaphelenchus okinawaensis]|uniref:C2H2-type domain-containing protein n=1 Tax=Bursaphelenchus okinawaensis TaxID=465554 RepID=A0A811KL74_9BILA|nr:unnamed protein product [Bursaphelenchus okinawaensis]CAG9106903.1 unnamed protein product [Bursaphelenchus okinawaensis]